MESQTTGKILQHVESDATSPSLDRSVSFEVIPSVTRGGDLVAEQNVDGDNEDQEQTIDNVQKFITVERTMRNPRMPSWLTTNMIMAYGLSNLLRRQSHRHTGKLKSVRSLRCERMS